jgi:hypothetical protein
MSSILKVDQIQLSNGTTPTAADLGINQSGSVIQFASSLKSAQQTTTSTSWSDISDWSISFTPKQANSKIRITTSFVSFGVQGWSGINIRLLLDGVQQGAERQIVRYDMQSNRTQYLYERHGGSQDWILNSWGTTAKTLKVQMQEANGNSQEAGLNGGPDDEHYMIIQEIAG